jgi:cytochrome P450
VWNSDLAAWMLTGFDDCTEVLTDGGGRFAMMNDDPELIFWFDGATMMMMVDGAEHLRLRRCLVPLFTRQAITKWEQRVGEVVDELLTPLAQGRDELDIIAEFTMIPTVIVAEMLGVPRDRYEDCRRWAHQITSRLAYGHEDSETRAAMRQAGDEVNAYLREEIVRRRREPQDDLITAMLKMAEMSVSEIRAAAVLLLLAGFDTTAKLMANSLVALEQHPAQRRLVAENPTLVPATIEEVFRWMGVSHMTVRRVERDTALADTELSPGGVVAVMFGAANRDPNRWEDAQDFKIERESKSHLGLGFGPHLCLGAQLARLETKVALERLLKIAPEYSLRDTDYGSGFLVRGLEQGTLAIRA